MVMDYITLKLDEINFLEKRVACIGFFDGLHLGHQRLIEKTNQLAKETGCKSSLITFSPDPWEVIKKMDHIEHLTPLNKRVELAKKMGIDEVIVVNFTESVSQLSSESFVKEILIPCNLETLICGFDYHYGFRGQGDSESLQKEAEGTFDVIIVESINQENKKISTTRICECLENGDITEANQLLGRMYEVEGIVISGNQKGREIGFPTANIQLNDSFLLPHPGVYCGKIKLDDTLYIAMINIGHNPTMNLQTKLSLEVHILNFDQSVYGKKISLFFDKFLRYEEKFPTLQELISQLEADRKNIETHYQGGQNETRIV
ncbi:MAG: riboflavin biosynthesis protein RibF [Anaerorhabdus sp.]